MALKTVCKMGVNLMNVTLVSLTLSMLGASPWVVAPSYTTQHSISFKNSAFFKSFGSFARCHFLNVFNFTMNSCRFRNFLDTAVSIQSVLFYNETIHIRRSFPGTSEVEFELCWFDQCHAKDTGGAVYIAQGQTIPIKCVIRTSSFSHCSALQGGAFAMNSGLLVIVSSCFVHCQATNYGQALVAISRPETATAYVMMSVAMCPNTGVKGRSSMSLMRYDHEMGYCNSSHNANNDIGVCLRAVDCRYLRMKYITVNNCSGTDAFAVNARAFTLEDSVIRFCTFQHAPIESPNHGVVRVHFYSVAVTGNSVNPSGQGYLDGNLTFTLERCYLDQDASKLFLTDCQVVNPQSSDPRESLSYWYSDACMNSNPQTVTETVSLLEEEIIVWGLAAVSMVLLLGGIGLIICIYYRKRREVAAWAVREGFNYESGDAALMSLES